MHVTFEQAIGFRMRVNHLDSRLPAGSYEAAAHAGLQDSFPRSALVSLHARVADCESTGWEDPRLIQTYSPRAAAYVLPRADFGVFTLGRAPMDADQMREIEARAEQVCRFLDGRRVRGQRNLSPEIAEIVRSAAPSGRIAIYWDARGLTVYEVPRPDVDLGEARLELCRRHVRAFGPSTPQAFARWSGVNVSDAIRTWKRLADELLDVDYEGRTAAILCEDEDAIRAGHASNHRDTCDDSAPGDTVRLLPAEETKLLLPFADSREPSKPDTFHPHPLVVSGRIVGYWGRRRGRVQVLTDRPLSAEIRGAVEREALSMPIPDATMAVEILDRF